jgi:hypothetical protein
MVDKVAGGYTGNNMEIGAIIPAHGEITMRQLSASFRESTSRRYWQQHAAYGRCAKQRPWQQDNSLEA